jgi:predicted regulator of Ras-like GTPase activity (Roadblock/LC7/MglB family)/Flp pilus assembly protein TadD
MSFLSKWMTEREISRLTRRIETNPVPDDFVRLILKHQEEKNLTVALRIAKRGIGLFPQHAQLKSIHDQVQRHERNSEKDRLRQKLQSFPNPTLFARLAELYKAEGSLDKAQEICRAGISNYPEYGGTYLVLGQVLLEKGDAAGGMQNIEKAIELEPYNYMALKMLGQALIQAGRPADAIERFNAILSFAPGDEPVMTMLRKAQQMLAKPAVSALPAAPPRSLLRRPAPPPVSKTHAPAAAEKPAPAPVEREKPAPAAAPAAGTAPPKHVPAKQTLLGEQQKKQQDLKRINLKRHVINDAITSFTSIEGVRGAVLVDVYGLVVASDMGIDIPDDLAGAMVMNLYRTTVQSADYLEVGEFEDGLVEGEHGHIHVFTINDMVLAVFADVQIKQGMLMETIRDFLGALEQVKQP